MNNTARLIMSGKIKRNDFLNMLYIRKVLDYFKDFISLDLFREEYFNQSVEDNSNEVTGEVLYKLINRHNGPCAHLSILESGAFEVVIDCLSIPAGGMLEKAYVAAISDFITKIENDSF